MILNVENFIFISTILFFIGVFGIALNRRSVIVVLISIEIMLLAVNINFIFFSVYLDNIVGQIIVIIVLTVAASESALGLAILVSYYKVHLSIETSTINILQS